MSRWGGGGTLTASEVGGDILELLYLLNGLFASEMDNQDPVAKRNVLQAGHVPLVKIKVFASILSSIQRAMETEQK